MLLGMEREGMGNTETRLPGRGGPCCCAGLATANWSHWVVLGEVPSLTQGTPCTLLCPSTLFSYVLLKRCFICPPSRSACGCWGWGGWHPTLGVCVGWSCLPWGTCPLPQPGWFPGSLAPTIPALGVPVGAEALGTMEKHDGGWWGYGDTRWLKLLLMG